MGLNKLQLAHLTFTINVLLEFTNAKRGVYEDFEAPIDSEYKMKQGVRLSLDLWSDPSITKDFVKEMQGACDQRTLDIVTGFQHSLCGPFYICECEGDVARLLYDDTVFEVHTASQRWKDMVPFLPDMIFTTLIPYDGLIVDNQFVLHHECHMQGPGAKRLSREYAEALKHGVVSSATEFARKADALNTRRRQGLMEPNCALLLLDYIEQINTLAADARVPFQVPECEVPLILRC